MEINERDLYITLFEKYKKMLTQTQRQYFQLYFFEDLSLREIADIAATSRSAIFDAINKAKKKLKTIDKQLNG